MRVAYVIVRLAQRLAGDVENRSSQKWCCMVLFLKGYLERLVGSKCWSGYYSKHSNHLFSGIGSDTNNS